MVPLLPEQDSLRATKCSNTLIPNTKRAMVEVSYLSIGFVCAFVITDTGQAGLGPAGRTFLEEVIRYGTVVN
jgi:hypothetical protein